MKLDPTPAAITHSADKVRRNRIVCSVPVDTKEHNLADVRMLSVPEAASHIWRHKVRIWPKRDVLMGVDDGSGAPGSRADDGVAVVKTRGSPGLGIIIMLLQEADKT